jgi:predicted phage terminase large subunit-like protein
MTLAESSPLAELVKDMDPDELRRWSRTLPPDDFALIEEKVADVTGEGWRTDPAAMAKHFAGQPLDTSWHHPAHVRFLSRKYRQLVTGESKRQIWNLPGRYGKSRLAQWGLVWTYDRAPDSRSMYICYGDDLADEGADAVRQILRFHAAELRCQLRRDRQRLDRFITDAGGGLLARGIDSAITGFGVGNGGGIVLDDPYKNWQEAHSEAQRKKIYDKFRGTLLNRLDDEAAWILIIHHRMHEADITAQLLADMLTSGEFGDQWDVSALAALAVPGDPLGRAPGEPLDPERFPRHVVLNRAAGLGTYLASALEQQNPTPEEGNDIKRAWFRIEAFDANSVSFDDSLVSWDTKMKDKESGSFVVGQVWGRSGTDFWCLAEFRGQWNQATMRAAMALAHVRFPFVWRQVVEYTGYGPEVIEHLTAGSGPNYELDPEIAGQLGMNEAEREMVQQLLRNGLPGILGSKPEGDKRVRARQVTPVIEARNCHLPIGAAFVQGFLAAFPNGSHDDRVDAMSQALSKLWGTDATLVQPEILMETRIPGVGRTFG